MSYRLRGLFSRFLPVIVLGLFLAGVSLSIWPPSPLSWETWLFSGGLALPYLVTGSLIWYVGRPRSAARLFCAHCAAVVLFLAVLPSPLPLLKSLAWLEQMGALFFLLRLLQALTSHYQAMLAEHSPGQYRSWQFYRRVVTGIGAACSIAMILPPVFPALMPLPGLLFSGFVALSLSGSCLWCLLAGWKTEEPREREQMRLVGVGMLGVALLSFSIPVLPRFLHLAAIPAWVPLLSLPAFPITLGYALLRPHLLFLDRKVRRVALWAMRGLLFPLITALIATCILTLVPQRTPGQIAVLAASLTCLGPLLWWTTRTLIPLLFAQETTSLQAFLAGPPAVASLKEATLLLTSAMTLASGSSQICLCLCWNDQNIFVPVSLFPSGTRLHLQHQLLQRAHALWGADWSEQRPFFTLPQSVNEALHTRLWLSLHNWNNQASARHQVSWRGWRTSVSGNGQQDILMLPLRVSHPDRLTGFVLLGPTEDGHPYAGPDLERMTQVVEMASPWLARYQHEERTRHEDGMLGQLYSKLALLPAMSTVEEVVRAYAQIVVSLGASMEAIWLDAPKSEPWLRAGSGPWLVSEERHALLAEKAHPHFSSSGERDWSCAVAFLPLQVMSSPLVLLVTLPHPTFFSVREQEYWHVLARHCQDRLEALILQQRQRESGTIGQKDGWSEQATLLTVLAGNLELALGNQENDAQAYLAVKRAAQAAQRLIETSAFQTFRAP